jgi:receptor protein-tyrosine kinase
VALALAAAGQQVLLLDGDLGKPTLASLTGIRPPFSWAESLRGRCTPEEAMCRYEAAGGMRFLALREPEAVPEELWSHPSLPEWLDQLRRDYGLIVVDGGSVWTSGARWAPWCDLAVVVCDSGRSAADEWAQAWDRLEEGGAHVLGIVETFG